jgi:hypothetical protein
MLQALQGAAVSALLVGLINICVCFAFLQVVFLHPKDNDGVLMELEEVGSSQST